jgi:glycosyltransferase involved in cell wall biosynthesis
LTIGALYSSYSKIPKIIYTRKSLFPIRNTIFNRYKYSRISQIIAISNAVAGIYSAIKVKVPVCIIHDAVPITNADLPRDDIRKQFGLKPEDFCIGSVAFFTREKNLPLLLKCAEYVEKTASSIKFLLIGPIEPSLEPEIKLHKSIIVTGYLQEATHYYSAFDAYISTSSSEGLGSALIDAIVRDIPSVAMDAGGTRDCFGGFSTPARTEEELLAQLGRIIADHSTARSNASKLGVWARSEFNVENFINKHIDIYNKVRQGIIGK